jgi:hypothetical protein
MFQLCIGDKFKSSSRLPFSPEVKVKVHLLYVDGGLGRYQVPFQYDMIENRVSNSTADYISRLSLALALALTLTLTLNYLYWNLILHTYNLQGHSHALFALDC